MQEKHSIQLIKLAIMKRKLKDCRIISREQNVQRRENGKMDKRAENQDERERHSNDTILISISNDDDHVDIDFGPK